MINKERTERIKATNSLLESGRELLEQQVGKEKAQEMLETAKLFICGDYKNE